MLIQGCGCWLSLVRVHLSRQLFHPTCSHEAHSSTLYQFTGFMIFAKNKNPNFFLEIRFQFWPTHLNSNCKAFLSFFVFFYFDYENSHFPWPTTCLHRPKTISIFLNILTYKLINPISIYKTDLSFIDSRPGRIKKRSFTEAKPCAGPPCVNQNSGWEQKGVESRRASDRKKKKKKKLCQIKNADEF